MNHKCQIKTVTPFIAHKTSEDWLGDCKRLEHTLHSVLAMSPSFIGAIVIGHDCPDFIQKNSRVIWVQAEHNSPGRDATNDDKRYDMGLKKRLGVRRAYEDGQAWMMFLDADDLVSKRLEGICRLKDHDAITIYGGYFWDTSGGSLRRSFRIHKACGSAHLVRLEPNWFPYWLGSAQEGPRVADQSHSEIHEALVAKGARIQRVHSPVIAYRVGSETSVSRNKIARGSGISVESVKNLLLKKDLSNRIIDEFSMRV